MYAFVNHQFWCHTDDGLSSRTLCQNRPEFEESMSASAEPNTSMPALVNSHTHSPFGPQFNGVIRSQSFEAYVVDMNLRYFQSETPEETYALALYTGYENLTAGNTAIIDQCFVPLNPDHFYAVTRAYEELGLQAWVFSELGDLPMSFYTKEAYSHVKGAITLEELPEELRKLCAPSDTYQDQLDSLENLLNGWHGKRVRIGIGLSNPVWCSDGLLSGAADLAKSLDIPINFHAEESPIQRLAHQEQWGMSGIERAAKYGLLGERTLVTHAVQVDKQDIQLMADSGCSMSHNPTSNLKLRNGIAPIGKMIEAGIRVCLGSDGHSSGDSQSLFPGMKMAVALADLNGLDKLTPSPEETVLNMARENGRQLWFDDDFSQDYIQFSSPIGAWGHVWDNPAPKIEEVFIAGKPRLAVARELIRDRDVDAFVWSLMKNLTAPELESRARELTEWVEERTMLWRRDSD
jgi:cytosine/adenosine deaminase-related metal-dependent hydrolase